MSPKPWAKVQIGRMRHQKFLALNGNAIALWDEGKDYCDEHMTDGLIPFEAVKTFRFRGAKSLALLTQSCGEKPDGTAYAPLWEAHAVGYKMHDFLDHNDCRELQMARMDRAEQRREDDRDRKADARAAKRLKSAAASAESPHGHPQEIRSISEPESATNPSLVKNTNEGGAPTAPPTRLAPLHDRSHRNHAHCGRICLHASLFGEFVRRRNHDGADLEIRDWCMEVEREWAAGGPREREEPGDAFEFWKARYAEKWPTAPAAKHDSRLPAWSQRAKGLSA